MLSLGVQCIHVATPPSSPILGNFDEVAAAMTWH